MASSRLTRAQTARMTLLPGGCAYAGQKEGI
jgi:hypothetical protein